MKLTEKKNYSINNFHIKPQTYLKAIHIYNKMDSIVLPSDFDVKNITYSEPRVLDNGGKVIYISYNKKKLVMQTPEMVAPFGLSKWNNEGKSADKYSFDLSFKGKESRDVLNKFFDGLKSFDKKLVEDGLTNCQTWFKKAHKSVDVVEALYTPIIKYAKDKNGDINDKYPPTFKMTVPHNGTNFACDVYDNNRNLVDLSSLETKGSRVSAIVQCVGIWVAGTKFGCSWKVLQMKITPPSTIKGYAFKEIDDKVEKDIDDDDEEDCENEAEAKDIMADAVASSDDDEVEESDDEDDDLEAKSSKSSNSVVVKKVTRK